MHLDMLKMPFGALYPHLPWSPDITVYDCSNKTLEEWIARGTPQPFMGIFSITFGIIAIFLYTLTTVAMTNKEYLKNSCFKLMYYASILDMVNLLFSNITLGYFFYIGVTYCTHPVMNFVAGGFATGIWCGSCLAVVALGFSRLAELTDHCKWMFDGKMVFFWIAMSLLWALFVIFMTKTALFNSTMGTWMFAPIIKDNLLEELEEFRNPFFILNNIITAISLISTYTIIVIFALTAYRKGSKEKRMSPIQMKLFFQSALICCSLCTTVLCYIYLELFEAPQWVALLAQLSYQTCECAPLLSYMIFNTGIRNKVLVILKLKKHNSVLYITNMSGATSSSRRNTHIAITET